MESDTARLSDLIGHVADGDGRAFAELYDAAAPRVYGLARRVLIDSDLSEDVVQETYLTVWRTADTYAPRQGSAMSWLLMIAHRRAVDAVRREQARTNREDRYETTAAPADGEPVDDAVIGRDEAGRVRNCLDTLTSAQRETIELAYYGGLTYRGVGERLRVGLPAIKSRMRDGLIRLKKCLGVDRNG